MKIADLKYNQLIHCRDESESITDEETAQPVEPESVNHPAHYGGENNPYEAIKVIEAHNLNFSMGNAVKYILRAGLKTPDKKEDLRKAIWCLNREIKRLDSELPRS
jgi:hypothetical protein